MNIIETCHKLARDAAETAATAHRGAPAFNTLDFLDAMERALAPVLAVAPYLDARDAHTIARLFLKGNTMPTSTGPLSTAWLVGDLAWEEKGDIHDWATVTVARTKTAARRVAERRLARAEYQWAKGGQRALDSRERYCHPKRRDWPLRRYAEWANAQGGGRSVIWRDWLLLQDGLDIYGPRGEVVHIAEASQRARRDVLRARRESAAFMGAMAAALRKGTHNV